MQIKKHWIQVQGQLAILDAVTQVRNQDIGSGTFVTDAILVVAGEAKRQ